MRLTLFVYVKRGLRRVRVQLGVRVRHDTVVGYQAFHVFSPWIPEITNIKEHIMCVMKKVGDRVRETLRLE